MKILIFGASGLAGSKTKEILSMSGHQVFGTYNTQEVEKEDLTMFQFQVGNREQFKQIVEQTKPEIIISCLRGDFQLQLDSHKDMADYIKTVDNGRLIFLSTCNVFDASLAKPHYEMDELSADSEYGKFKIACEEMLTKILGDKAIIIRIPMIYGKDCLRVKLMKEAIKTKKPIQAISNLFMNYTTNTQIAQWIDHIIEHNLTGVFHIGTTDMLDYEVFQKRVVECLGYGEAIFDIEKEEKPIYQAVLPGRSEIPRNLQMTVDDLMKYLA